jgi:hypothetical protein
MSKLVAEQVAELDPYAFLAVLGKRVIHPGGRASTDRLLEWAAVQTGEHVLDIGCGRGIYTDAGLADVRTESGPFAMMTARGFLADEGAHAAAVMARGLSRPAYLRKMVWLMPRMARAVPYLGYVLVLARKPDRISPGEAK